eukprot:scaffold16086_cov117-Isochrysis_galbana.AAC.2
MQDTARHWVSQRRRWRVLGKDGFVGMARSVEVRWPPWGGGAVGGRALCDPYPCPLWHGNCLRAAGCACALAAPSCATP